LGFALKQDEQTGEKLAYEEMRKKLMDSLKRVFRPEFINRLDSVIVFRALSKQDIQEIVKLELDKVSERLKDHDISLIATPVALDMLAELGYDSEMGARPLKRIIQQKVEDVLSDALLSGTFTDGDTIVVDYREEEVVLRREVEKEPAAEGV
jgi:ATP-dependent Clp protease ATP-binding subunit ClpC